MLAAIKTIHITLVVNHALNTGLTINLTESNSVLVLSDI